MIGTLLFGAVGATLIQAVTGGFTRGSVPVSTTWLGQRRRSRRKAGVVAGIGLCGLVVAFLLGTSASVGSNQNSLAALGFLVGGIAIVAGLIGWLLVSAWYAVRASTIKDTSGAHRVKIREVNPLFANQVHEMESTLASR